MELGLDLLGLSAAGVLGYWFKERRPKPLYYYALAGAAIVISLIY